MLGRNYAFENVKALYPEDLEEYRQVFLAAGIEAFF
jgi:pyruvate formate lyase activating enzyme